MSKLPVEETSPHKNSTIYRSHRYTEYRDNKVSVDIVRALSTTESGHLYILTIKDLLTKFFVEVPLKQATSAEITEALVEKFINSYTAEDMDVRDRIS